MLRFLISYHFEKMALWFLLLPIGAILLTIPFLLLSDVHSPFLYGLLVATVIVIAMFLEQTIAYQTMLRTMPVAVHTIVQVKFLFGALILMYQLILLAIAVSNQATNMLAVMTVAVIFFTLAMNLILLHHFYTGQQKNSTTMGIIFYAPLVFSLQYGESFLFSNITVKMTAILLLLTLALTFANKQLCLYFAKTKNHY